MSMKRIGRDEKLRRCRQLLWDCGKALEAAAPRCEDDPALAEYCRSFARLALKDGLAPGAQDEPPEASEPLDSLVKYVGAANAAAFATVKRDMWLFGSGFYTTGEDGQIKRVDPSTVRLACTAHVDPLAQQQAQTAGQMGVQTGTQPCMRCGSWLKPNNGVTVAGKLYHVGCAPGSLAGSQKICGCGECTDAYAHTSDCAVHNEPARPKGPCDCAGRQHLAVGAAPSFSTQVSDALARQREIGGTAPTLPMETEAEKLERNRKAIEKIWGFGR